jgi:hypothetical protein
LAQTAGRNTVFEDYRLRVGPVIAEGGEGGGVIPLSHKQKSQPTRPTPRTESAQRVYKK